MTRRTSLAVLLLVTIAISGACAFARDDAADGGIRAGCEPVNFAVSPEKLDLLQELAREFNNSDAAEIDGSCFGIRVHNTASGAGAQLLAEGWPNPEVNGPRPVVWSPASAAWGGVLNQRLANRGEAPMAPTDATPFMVTPLVIGMPKPMAEALGYPDTPIGWDDLLALARDPEGWGSKGHPEWGRFKLGKTNPNFSTSGLNATISQYYAAVDKQENLTLEDVNRPDVDEFMRGVESAVVHYGDTTLTFLNNMYRSDRAGAGLTYVSAVTLEEKSIVDYNAGNPDGILESGEEPRPPRVPLVAVYPEGGTLYSDNPFFVLDAEWVTDEQRAAARAFERFVQEPDNQRRVLRFGFRPGNPQVDLADPITRSNGLLPDQPERTLGVPEPEVLVHLIDRWEAQRKGARVLLVIDVSGSMGEEVEPGITKLDLAKDASIDALDQFKGEDLVGLRLFTTNISPQEPTDYTDVLPIEPIAEQREAMRTRIRNLVPLEGTPLYQVAIDSFEKMKAEYDPDLINAIVLLTDGRNEDDFNDLNETLNRLRAGSEGQSAQPVRLFTIAYGGDADKATLRRMAEATQGKDYDASDPETISRVFTAVISNF